MVNTTNEVEEELKAATKKASKALEFVQKPLEELTVVRDHLR